MARNDISLNRKAQALIEHILVIMAVVLVVLALTFPAGSPVGRMVKDLIKYPVLFINAGARQLK